MELYVNEIPKNCAECKFKHWDYYDDEDFVCNFSVSYDNCPLKPLPERESCEDSDPANDCFWCSNCNFAVMHSKDRQFTFCPNCGGKIKRKVGSDE